MFCPNCGSQVDDNAMFCPSCGMSLQTGSANMSQGGNGGSSAMPAGGPVYQSAPAAKPKKKKWPKIVAVCVVLLVVLFACVALSGDDSSSTGQSGSTAVSESADDSANENVAAFDDTESSQSAYTAYDIFLALQDNEAIPYTLGAKASEFLKENNDLFIGPASERKWSSSQVDNSVTWEAIAKNDSRYGDKLISVQESYVTEIYEEDLGDGEYFTTLGLIDGNSLYQYMVYYFGSLDGIYENDAVSVVGLPLGFSQFDNTNGGQTRVVVLAGCEVKKLN